MQGQERQFVEKLKDELGRNFPKYIVTAGECLVYRFIIDPDGQLQPGTYTDPKRGGTHLAFQTDLLVKKTEAVPLVVVETKYAHFTTHDILTYSAKAARHKEIYPYLRYGLVIGGISTIQKRFFTHNTDFDFGLAIDNTENLSEAIDVIGSQLQAAEGLLGVLGGKPVKRYVSKIELS